MCIRDRPFGVIMRDMVVNGVGLPWNIVLSALVGVWLILTPWALGATGLVADANHLIGALVATVSVTCLAETARPLRFVNMGFGLALILTTAMAGADLSNLVSGVLCGLALIALSVRRGPITCGYGNITRFLI